MLHLKWEEHRHSSADSLGKIIKSTNASHFIYVQMYFVLVQLVAVVFDACIYLCVCVCVPLMDVFTLRAYTGDSVHLASISLLIVGFAFHLIERVHTGTHCSMPVHILSKGRKLPHFAFSIMSCFTCFVVDMWKPHKARLIVITASARLRCCLLLYIVLLLASALSRSLFLSRSLSPSPVPILNVKIIESEVSCQH